VSAKRPLHDLCALDDIRVPGSRGFELDGGGAEAVKLFVVRKEDVLAAYRNRCPHTGAPLEWLPDQFLDMDDGFIQCAIHGALFRPEDGYCVRGPCVGASLEGLGLEVVDGRVQVCLPAADLPPDADPAI
jgi:nitrite reductase/ring-hydroxylating ferredoxin subunit